MAGHCAPVCTPITQNDGTNSCYGTGTLPATGASEVGFIVLIALGSLAAGAIVIGISNRAGR